MLANTNGALKKSKRQSQYIETNENKKITIQNVQDEAIAVQRGKFIDKTIP